MQSEFDRLLKDILLEMPVLICIAQPESGIVFCNKIAENLKNGLADGETFVKNLESAGDNHFTSLDGKWFQISTWDIDWVDGKKAIMYVGIDYSKMRDSEKILTETMYTDSLTGIYNRQLALDLLQSNINEMKTGGPVFTCCYLDINDLKYVNDNFGHAEGDEYILSVVSVIKGAIRQTDIFARMAGDEFLIIFPKCVSRIVENIMETVVNKLEVITATNENEIRYSISYGIYEANEQECPNVDQLLNTIDNKMYAMKKDYRKNNPQNR